MPDLAKSHILKQEISFREAISTTDLAKPHITKQQISLRETISAAEASDYFKIPWYW